MATQVSQSQATALAKALGATPAQIAGVSSAFTTPTPPSTSSTGSTGSTTTGGGSGTTSSTGTTDSAPTGTSTSSTTPVSSPASGSLSKSALAAQVVSTVTNPDGTVLTTFGDGHTEESTGAYFPRGNTSGGGTSPTDNANVAVDPTAPLSLDEAVAQISSLLEPAITAAQDAETSAESQANQEATDASSAANFSLNAAGLAGSSEANSMASAIETQRNTEIETAKSAQATAIANVSESAASIGESLFTTEQSYNATQGAALLAKNLASGQAAVKNLAASGVSLNQYQETDPTGYSNLLSAYNGDENSLKADFISASTPTIIGSPIVNGNSVTFLQTNPTNPSVPISTTLQLPFTNISASDVKVVPNQGLFARDPNTNQWTYIGGANPYYQANQAATLQTKDAMITSRYGTAVNNILTQLFPSSSANPFNLYGNSLNYTAKLDAAYNASTASDTPDKGVSDVDLIDSYIKIANGGGQITDSQLDALNQSLNLVGSAGITLNKLTGTSELLTDDQRQTIYNLAQANIKAQQANALAATKVVAQRASAAGIPSGYITTPEDVMGLSAASDPQADAAASAAVGSVVQDANGLPDGTTGTDDNGDPMVVQGGEWVSGQ